MIGRLIKNKGQSYRYNHTIFNHWAGIIQENSPRRFQLKFIQKQNLSKLFVLSVFLAASPLVKAVNGPFDRIVVFGASLSDPGNAFVLLSDPETFGFDGCDLGTTHNVPPYDQMDKFYPSDDFFVELLIPDGVYAKGGHHVSNGATWIEQFAQGQGLSGNVKPALRTSGLKASNYAVGGARALDVDCRFNLSDQLYTYFNDFDIDDMSPRTLVILEIGGNDVRDALLAPNSEEIMINAIARVQGAIETLFSSGATSFLLVNVTDIGKTPAVANVLDQFIPGIAFKASLLSSAFNDMLLGLQQDLNDDLSFAGIDVRTLDLHGLLEEIIDDQQNNDSELFDIENVSDACITPNNPPFFCKRPDTYLFWDGIHPTKAVHSIMAQKAADVLMAASDN